MEAAHRVRAGAPVGSRALGQYAPAIDGLRAVAMSAVFAFHLWPDTVPGGWLGVSLFFTLSGFLITSMLLRGRAAVGSVDLRSFWVQRYRRLLPASAVTLAGVVLFGFTVATGQQLVDLPGDIMAALAQLANWRFVFNDSSYVDLFAAPSPVQHFWSLAIEEQLYIVLPLVVFVLVRRTVSLRVIGAVLALGAIGSTLLTVALFENGASLDRLYYGTDTRAGELLVGAVLAVVLHGRPVRFGPTGQRLLDGVGFGALGLSIWAWATVSLTDAVVYRGGLMLSAIVSVVLILVALSGRGLVAGLLTWGVLPAYGRITYGVYLFHWPVLLWLTEERTGLGQWPLLALRLAMTFGLAIVSYRIVEMPIRRRHLVPTTLGLAAVLLPVAALIAGGSILLREREVETVLAGLGEGVAAAPAVGEKGDGTLDVVVVGDAAGMELGADLLALAAADDLSVTLAEPFACAAIVETATSTICGNWVEEWSGLVARLDPDVVLFHVSEWDRSELASISETEDFEEQMAFTTEVLGSGFDLLTSGGATVVWDQAPSDLADGIRRRSDPFHQSMVSLTSERSDTRPLRVTSQPASELVADLALYQRSDLGDVPRVLFIGDSVSRTLGYGFERWAAANGELIVWSAGTEGCGLADDGVIRDATGRDLATPASCESLPTTRASQVAQFDPDLVIVTSMVNDLRERRLEEWSGFLEPGDAAFDDYLVAEYQAVVDTLSAGGATVLWTQNPCAVDVFELFDEPDSGNALDTTRIRHVNEEILPRLAQSRPTLRLFDLFSLLCPDGEFVADVGGIENLRPDGVHFSAAGSLWLAETYGREMLDEGFR